MTTAPIYTWNTLAGGDFMTPTNWSGGVVPGYTDDADLKGLGAPYTVTVDVPAGTGPYLGIVAINGLQTAAGVTLMTTGHETILDFLEGTDGGVSAGTVQISNYTAIGIEGTFTNTGTIALVSTGNTAALGVSDLTLNGGGTVSLSDVAVNPSVSPFTNVIAGLGAGSTFFNNVDNTISGAGLIGEPGQDLAFYNRSAGIIDASGVNPLRVEPGLTLSNAGLMEDTGSGGLTLYGLIGNSGTIDGAAGGGVTIAAGATVNNTGGTLEATGYGNLKIDAVTVDNSDGVIRAQGVLGQNRAVVDLYGAHIIGGTLESFNGGIVADGYGVILDGTTSTLTNTGDVYIFNSADLTLDGAIRNKGSIGVYGGFENAGLLIGVDGVTLSGGGSVVMGSGFKNIIEDAGKAGALTNVDNTIRGGGFIETPLTLVNEAAGVIDADNGRLVINVAGTVTNAGLIEATGTYAILLVSNTTIDSSSGGTVEDGKQIQLNKATLLGGTLDIQAGASLLSSTFASTINLEGGVVTNAGTLEGAGGGLTVDGDVANTGLVIVETGALTITGAVTGTGRVEVFGKGTLVIDGAQGGTVGFGKGATGRLVLGDSAAFTGSITGFSKTGANSIDLNDIAYGTGDTVTFKANKSVGSGGVLTVTDGTHTASIKFAGGNYSGSTFTLTADSGTGVIVTAPSAHAFIAAMASLPSHAGAGALPAVSASAARPALLASPSFGGD